MLDLGSVLECAKCLDTCLRLMSPFVLAMGVARFRARESWANVIYLGSQPQSRLACDQRLEGRTKTRWLIRACMFLH